MQCGAEQQGDQSEGDACPPIDASQSDHTREHLVGCVVCVDMGPVCGVVASIRSMTDESPDRSTATDAAMGESVQRALKISPTQQVRCSLDVNHLTVRELAIHE